MCGKYEDDFEEFESDTNSSQEIKEAELRSCVDDQQSELSSGSADEIEAGFDDISNILESDSVIQKSSVSRDIFNPFFKLYVLFSLCEHNRWIHLILPVQKNSR